MQTQTHPSTASAALAALRDPLGWLGTVVLLLCFAAGAALDGPTETEAAQATADSVQALPAAHAAVQP